MKKDLDILLVHFKSPELGENWRALFKNETNVQVIDGDIFELNADAIVSPGNSFGFMDGGLDLLISKKLGWSIQRDLRNHIKSTALKELLVGQAVCIESENKIVVCAPTMRVPTSVGIKESVNAYLAMKAILIEAKRNDKIKSIAIPGLCTGTGQMPADIAAKQMHAAYNEVVNGIQPDFQLYIDALKHHKSLIRSS